LEDGPRTDGRMTQCCAIWRTCTPSACPAAPAAQTKASRSRHWRACIDQPGCTRITDECVKALAGVHTINLEGCSITDSCCGCGCRPKLLAAAPASQMRGAPSSGAPHLGVVCAPRRTAFARNSAAAQSTDQPDHYHEQTIVGSAHTMLSTPASTARTDGTSARTPIGTRTCAHIRPSTTTQPALWPAGQAYPATPPPHPSRLMRVGVVR